jgi:predicted O-linked N-acetylglucosamine transferase (SPINDLY family)
MAGSLLKSIGLEELITFNADDYEKTAIRMAINPNEITALRDKIQAAKEQGKLFNTDTFTREFEAALQAVLKGQS